MSSAKSNPSGDGRAAVTCKLFAGRGIELIVTAAFGAVVQQLALSSIGLTARSLTILSVFGRVGFL